MNKEYIEHIALYHDLYPQGFCSHLISEFDRLESEGVGWNRQNSEGMSRHLKEDHSIGLELRNHTLKVFDDKVLQDIFFNGLQECYNDYSSKYSVLTHASIRATTMKVQRTGPGGGYHVWHNEQGNGAQANRGLVYMLYLNTFRPEEGGETEFLYQKKRFLPKENTMVFWPAAYTHAHRGNTVLGDNSKYIVTGWFYYD
jgi:hypothetical protein